MKYGQGDDIYYLAIIRLYGLLIASGNFPNVPAWLQRHAMVRAKVGSEHALLNASP